MAKSALIMGITGQDGSYLAELLLEKGYTVYGLVRRLSTPNIARIAHIIDKLILLEGDVTDQCSLVFALQKCKPDEVYCLAAQSFVPASWSQPILTGDVDGLGMVRVLETVRNLCKEARIYNAGSSEMFGACKESPQNEKTPFNPRNPYACARVYAHHMSVTYRESYGLKICSGILFNHESPRRGLEFVTRKITNSVARIHFGLDKELHLGNLEARRDWGFAGDYVKAMWLMLQQEKPDDYVIATGETHSVKEFAELAFKEAGLDWQKYVVIDKTLYRPVDVFNLCGDYSKARGILGWKPGLTFKELVSLMVKADLERVGNSIK